jgi:hypothetical protein
MTRFCCLVPTRLTRQNEIAIDKPLSRVSNSTTDSSQILGLRDSTAARIVCGLYCDWQRATGRESKLPLPDAARAGMLTITADPAGVQTHNSAFGLAIHPDAKDENRIGRPRVRISYIACHSVYLFSPCKGGCAKQTMWRNEASAIRIASCAKKE